MGLGWGKDQEMTFILLKEELMKAPILMRPDFDREFILQTDFSGTGLGAVLSQVDTQNRERVIAYASRSLSKAEEALSASEGECLAVVWAVEKFRLYLLDKKFRLQTDHEPLRALNNAKLNNNKWLRWAISLQQYDFEIQYKKGKDNGNADALSRRNTNADWGGMICMVNGTENKAQRHMDPWLDRQLLNCLRGDRGQILEQLNWKERNRIRQKSLRSRIQFSQLACIIIF